MTRPVGLRLHTEWGKTRRLIHDMIIMGKTMPDICTALGIHVDTYRVHLKKLRTEVSATTLDDRIMVATEQLYLLLAERKGTGTSHDRAITDPLAAPASETSPPK